MRPLSAEFQTTMTTALAPLIWGSTYVVTTELLPPDRPLTVAVLRALPAGLLLLLVVRRLPQIRMLPRLFVLGGLNFTLFWSMLFIAAYRLPGGVAATVGAVQPLLVVLMASALLGAPIRTRPLLAALGGLIGVALLVLTPRAALDPWGVAAGLTGAVSMALGTVLSRRWQIAPSPLVATAWQLTAGGLLLVPLALLIEPPLPPLTAANVAGLTYLGVIGAALTYLLWFRGVARLAPSAVASLGFLSPVSAVLLGYVALHQVLSLAQCLGLIVVGVSVTASQQRSGKSGVPVTAAALALQAGAGKNGCVTTPARNGLTARSPLLWRGSRRL